MKRSREKWLWLFGLPLFVGVLAHWGFHFYVKDELDDLIREAEPRFDIRYTEVATSLSGRVEVAGIQVRGAALTEPLVIDRLLVQGPNPASYFWHNNPISGTGPPGFLRLLAHGMELELEEPRRARGDGCDLHGGIPPQTLKRLGFESLEGNASAAYDFQPDFHVLEVSADLEISGIQNVKLEARLQNVTPEGFRRGQLGTAALSELTMTFDVHPTFGKRLVEYCAARRQLTPRAFEAVLARTLLEEVERAGVIPGPDLETALEHYVRHWGTLEMSLLPPVPMNLVFIPFVPTEQLHSKLGFEMYINGKQVRGLRFGRMKVAVDEDSPRSVSQPRRFKPFRKQWLYREVSPAALPAYIGHRVRLKERGDPVRSGLLVEVSNGKATVQQWIDGGKFMAHLSLGELTSAEVLLLKVVEDSASAAQESTAEKAEPGDTEAAAEQGQQAGGEPGDAGAADEGAGDQ